MIGIPPNLSVGSIGSPNVRNEVELTPQIAGDSNKTRHAVSEKRRVSVSRQSAHRAVVNTRIDGLMRTDA